MELKIDKKDIIWGYFSHFFSIAAGIIVLPFMLRILSPDEIGMNYLMLTISSMVTLFDFGFAPQFGRNITYVFSGARELKKEGIEIVSGNTEINYRLLSTMIHTAKFVYRRLGIVVLIFMLSLGSLYIYKVTDGFTSVRNAFFIWVMYSISIFFNIYYSYYTSLLTGKGLIMESKKAMVYSRITYIILVFILLFLGVGLLGVVLAGLIAPFVNRYISYYFFFTKELKEKINKFTITSKEKVELFSIIWHNAKKLGLVFVGAYAITKLSMFLAGLYLSLSEIASYGLMIQLIGLIMTISSTFFVTYQPKLSNLRIKNDKNTLLKDFSFTMNIYYMTFLGGVVCAVAIIPWCLSLINSNVVLPSVYIIIIYSFVILLEGNHSHFATFIVMGNDVPFVKPSLIAGGAIALGSFILLKYTSLGILGLVLVQGLCQLVYANWKWPLVVCKEFRISFFKFVSLGFHEMTNKLKINYKNYIINGK
jgi:O-antigen/teichoic acid export membrane protein